MDDASFVPPPAERVPELMEDLVAYLNTGEHPVEPERRIELLTYSLRMNCSAD